MAAHAGALFGHKITSAKADWASEPEWGVVFDNNNTSRSWRRQRCETLSEIAQPPKTQMNPIEPFDHGRKQLEVDLR